MNLGYDQAVVRYVIGMCINDDVIQYYANLHDHHQKEEMLNRKSMILTSNAKMIQYYRNHIDTSNTCLYNSLLPDYFRYITSRWRLSNHNLKIETLRYNKDGEIPREMRLCTICLVVEDEQHVIYQCPRFRIVHQKFNDILKKNCTIDLFLNPKLEDIKTTASFLHDIERIINDE